MKKDRDVHTLIEANQRLRFAIIRKAVAAADKIIMDEMDGSVETLLWLSLEMANVYQDKATNMVTNSLYQKLALDAVRGKGSA